MAKTDIGPKIGIEGEAQFRRELAQINQGMKTLDAEAKAVAASMQDETDAEKKAAAQKDVLNRQILTQKEKLEQLEKGLEASAKKYGEADTRTQKWQKAVYDATTDLANMEHELKGLDGSIDEAADSMEEAEQAAGGWAEIMKGELCADAVKLGVDTLASIVKDAATALWEASKAGAAYADTYNTMSAVTGLSTEQLQEYAYMADLLDVSVDTLTSSQTKLLNNMRKAKDGTGEAAETWEALGVNIKNADGSLRDTEDVMSETLTALKGIENETERDAAAMAIFGKSAQDLNPLIKAGADQIEKLRKEAHDTGYVLSGESLSALNKQQDAMDRLSKKTEAVSNTFAAKLAPSVTSVYDTIGETLDNPRTQRAINVLAEGVGSFMDTLAGLAASVIPEIVSAFGIFDSRLATYSDEQLIRLAEMDEMAQAWGGMNETFKTDADAIWEEHEKADALYKKLQSITDENGNVDESNRALADYIVNTLNEDLGLNIQYIDGIVQGWQNVQKEIEAVIEKNTAQSLMAAGEEKYAFALANVKEASTNAALALQDLQSAEEELAEKEAKHKETLAEIEEKYGDVAEAPTKVRLAYVEEGKAVTTLKDKVEALTEDYQAFEATADELAATTESYSKALAAQAEGDYQAVIDYTTKGYNLERDYISKKGQLDRQSVEALKKKYEDQEAYVAYYEEQLKKKKAGYSEEGLAAEKKELVKLLNAVSDGWTQIYNESVSQARAAALDTAKAWSDGLINGMNENQKRIYKAAHNSASTIKTATRDVLQIASPSKVGTWIGEMWDEGLIDGMEKKEAKLAETVERLSGLMIAGGYSGAGVAGTGSYGSAMTRPIGGAGGYNSTNSYTTNLGGISITIPGAGGMNEELLAQQIAVQLTDALQRAQRGGHR